MTYEELISLVQRYLKRSDLNDLIPTWISFAGKRIDSDCRLAQQEFRAVTVPTAGYIPLPLGFIELRAIQAEQSGGPAPVQYVTPKQLDVISRSMGPGAPSYYTIIDNQVQLVPAPTDENTAELEIFYYAKQPTLKNPGDTTPVLTAFPNLWLYGVLVEAMPFMENQPGQATWAEMWASERDLLNARAEAARYSGDSLQMRAS